MVASKSKPWTEPEADSLLLDALLADRVCYANVFLKEGADFFRAKTSKKWENYDKDQKAFINERYATIELIHNRMKQDKAKSTSG